MERVQPRRVCARCRIPSESKGCSSMRVNVQTLGAVVLLAAAACDDVIGLEPSAHARVTARVVNEAGQAVAGADVSVREARPFLPYSFVPGITDAAGEGSVLVQRLAGPGQAAPDTVSFFVVASRHLPGTARIVRDSTTVTLQFGRPEDPAPATDVRLVMHE